MASLPGYVVTVYAGHRAPVVWCTAGTRREARQLDAWLAENPDLDELVRRATELADSADDDEPFWPELKG